MPLSRSDTSWLLDTLCPAIDGTRQRRKSIENEWLQNYKAWQGWPSQSYTMQLADGGVHYFIPHARRAIETAVRQCSRLVLPRTDWFQTLPFDLESHEQAEAVQALMLFTYQNKIQSKRLVSSLSRSLYLYNFSILNTSIRIENDEVWPIQKDIDPFSFYFFPDTASTRDECTLIFEDTIIPYQVYNSFVDSDDIDKSMYLPIRATDLRTPEWPYHIVERIAYRGLSTPSDFMQGQGNIRRLTEEALSSEISKTEEVLNAQNKAFVSLTKCYFRIGSTWHYCIICNNMQSNTTTSTNRISLQQYEIVRLDTEEFSPNYRWTNSRPMSGEFYTNSSMDDKRVLQNLANSAISQVESHRASYAEPPLFVDRSMMGRMESKTLGNRQIWDIDAPDGNVSRAFAPFPVQDTSSEGIKAWQIYLQIMNQGSGGGLSEGDPGRNVPRAGFAADNIMSMALTEPEDMAGFIEQDLLTPGLADIYNTFQTFVPTSQLFKIPSKEKKLPLLIRQTELYGSYSFIWEGALGFQSEQARADKLMSFLTILMQPSVLQVLVEQLHQQGLSLDFTSLFKTVYTYGLGERGLSNLIIPMTQQEQQAYQQQQQLQQEQVKEQQELNKSKVQERQSVAAMKQSDAQVKQGELKLKALQTQHGMQKDVAEHQGKAEDRSIKRHEVALTYLSKINSNGKTSNETTE